MSTISFRIGRHSINPNTEIVEILADGVVCGVIYPQQDKSIKLVSAHIEEHTTGEEFAGEVIADDGSTSWPPIPSLIVRFKSSPYIIEGNRIVKQFSH